MNRIPLESEEARTLVHYLQLKGYKFQHSPNETGSSPESRRRAIRMKQQGTSPGFPDYIIIVNNKLIAIELKRIKGSRTSPEQLEWILALNMAGIPSTIAKGAGEAIEFIEEHAKSGVA